jgi:hypothetical protein
VVGSIRRLGGATDPIVIFPEAVYRFIRSASQADRTRGRCSRSEDSSLRNSSDIKKTGRRFTGPFFHHPTIYFLVFTGMVLAFASSAVGKVRVSTPFSNCASAFSESTLVGKFTDRLKEP